MKVSEIKRMLFFTVVGIAFIARVYSLNTIPPHPSLDEVSIGYNAYSILKTGTDEYGTKFPILLRAYDDWRPALYAYLAIPFIKVFGLTVGAVRLPSVILSVISVFATFFLARELLKKNKNTASGLFYIPLFSALLLAISPWHVYISRLGHEANAALAFLIFGIYFFLHFVNRVNDKSRSFYSRYSIVLSSVFLSLSFSSYQSTKIVVPLIVLLLTSVYFKNLLVDKRKVLFALGVGILITIPILVSITRPQALIRFKGTNVFNSSPQRYEETAKKLLEEKRKGNLIGEIMHNRRLTSLSIFSEAYFSHLRGSFLFGNSKNESFKAPNSGLLYLFEIPLLLVGMLVLNKYVAKSAVVIFWILIAIIPGAITTGYPHAMRVFSVLPIPQIISSAGLFWSISYIGRIRQIYLKRSLLLVIFMIVSFSFVQFLYNYFSLFPKKLSYQFQYGVLGAFDYVKSLELSYDSIIVSNKDNLFQSYMFYLFANTYDPFTYQKMKGTGSAGFDKEHKIGKYFFTNPLSYKKDNKKTLFIVNVNEADKIMASKIAETTFLDSVSSVVILSAN